MQDLAASDIFIMTSTGMTWSGLVLLHRQQAAPMLRRRRPRRRRWRRIVCGAAWEGRRLFSREYPRRGTGGRARRDHENQQQHGHHCGLPHRGLGGASSTGVLFFPELLRRAALDPSFVSETIELPLHKSHNAT